VTLIPGGGGGAPARGASIAAHRPGSPAGTPVADEEASTMTAPAEIATTPADGAPAHRSLPIGHGEVLRALERNIERNTVTVEVPPFGTLRLPPLDTLAWLGGVATLAVLGVVEWPVATVIGAGHLLAHQHHLRLLHDFGEALEQA
jgi:hypothetical protein